MGGITRSNLGNVTKSVANSTATLLTEGQTFVGEWVQTDSTNVGATCKTDNVSTLYFDFSDDGASVSSTFPSDGFEIPVGSYKFYSVVKLPKYFRARLVNNTGNQTSLSLNVYYGSFGQEDWNGIVVETGLTALSVEEKTDSSQNLTLQSAQDSLNEIRDELRLVRYLLQGILE
jgi:hypothetical protein